MTGKRNTHSYSKTVQLLIWEIMYGHLTQHFLLLGNWLSSMVTCLIWLHVMIIYREVRKARFTRTNQLQKMNLQNMVSKTNYYFCYKNFKIFSKICSMHAMYVWELKVTSDTCYNVLSFSTKYRTAITEGRESIISHSSLCIARLNLLCYTFWLTYKRDIIRQ